RREVAATRKLLPQALLLASIDLDFHRKSITETAAVTKQRPRFTLLSFASFYLSFMETGTTSNFYAGVNQPTINTSTTYVWTPIIILAVGIAVLTIALVRLSRVDRRDLPSSFFDQWR
ncbi:MAG: hypothetical protein ACREGR_04915, partial [Minisyncoccia bacterium]